ncbi:MAG TPA: lamin tail domain-containing protein [Myxococcales bacterium]|jgi:hypothetical protein
MSRRILTLACAGLLLAVGTGCPTASECTKTTDCKDGKQCVDSKCVVPSSACSPACSGATSVCDETAKKCKTCTASRGCTGGKLCDTSASNGKCVNCLTSANCGLEAPVCDTSTGTCVVCTDGDGCQIGETCDTTVAGGECVSSGCSADLDCQVTPATPVCDAAAHKCVVCTAAKGCIAPATCDTAVTGGQCKGCSASAQCSGPSPVCDTGSGKCVVCTATEGCTAPQACDTGVQGGQCKQPGCNNSLDCAATPATPVCDTGAKKCVVCTAAEGCANGKKCDATVQGGQCVDATCAGDADCTGTAATPICDTASGKCVVCTAAKGCTAPATCDLTVTGGQCKGCTASAQCTAGSAKVCDLTSGKCVVCTTGEGCGATEHCDTAVADGKCVSNGCVDNGGCTGTPATPTCDTATGKCVVCTATSGCAAPLVCDTGAANGKCVDCLLSADCKGSAKVCDQKKCVNCTASAGCSGPTPVCDTTAAGGACVICTATSEAVCTAASKVCDASAKKCVTCTSAKGCASPTPVCDTAVTDGACVGCTSSTQCAAASPAKPVCDTATKTCVACTSGEGCTGKVCQNQTACVECLQNTDCKVPASPLCDTAQNKCVTCTALAGCSSPQTCQNGQCVGCTSNTECSGATPICNTATATCVVCNAAQGCASPKTCDTTVTGGQCVGCGANADCAAPTPACNLTSGRCVACTDTFGCSSLLPKCLTGATPACVQCLAAADCAAPTPVCGPSNTCVAGSTDVTAQIAAARANGAGTGLSLPIDGALVTYLKPATGTEKAGFFVQGAQAGPALFVEVDPATVFTAPAATLAAGDQVSFTITELAVQAGLLYAKAISGPTRASQGNDLSGLIQDVGNAADLVSAIANYEAEYVKVAGTLGALGNGGTGYAKFPLTTAAITATPFPSFRIPTTLKDSLGLDAGCVVDLRTGVMWRYNTDSEPSCFRAGDLVVTSCPAPKVIGAGAVTNASVSVSFSRTLDVASVAANGSQFTFDNGLTASAAAASGSSVSLTTSAQTVGTTYTVTVASTVKDTRAAGVDGTAATATFTGLAAGCAPGVVISQVYGGGGNSGAQFTNDFVELHNRSTNPVDVTNWSVQYTSATGTSWSSNLQALCSGTCTTRSIPAGGYLLIQLAAGTTPSGALPTPDVTGTIAMAGANGKVALVASKTALTGNCPAGVIDFVGYGTADCPTNKVGALSNSTAAIRNGAAASPGTGCDFTGNNTTDFTVAAPSPRNSATTAVTCGCD